MTEPIRINADVLREVAGGHDEVARIVEDARGRGGDILAAVESYGPIMHEFKAAVGDLVLDRDNALSEHVHRAAHEYTDTDDQNARNIGQL